MDLLIHDIKGQGDPKTELVWLRAKTQLQLSDYVIADTTYDANGNPSNEVRHMYWFPSDTIKKDEWVALYTGPGVNYVWTSKEGAVVHEYHRNLDRSIWNKTGDRAVLFKIAEVATTPVPASTATK